MTPPGPAGSGPQLALVYRSGHGRGNADWLGVGWRLAGESAIARDVSRGVPFDYASSCGEAPCYLDAFAFDGEPLVCAEASCDGEFRTLHHEGLRIRAADQGFQVRERRRWLSRGSKLLSVSTFTRIIPSTESVITA